MDRWTRGAGSLVLLTLAASCTGVAHPSDTAIADYQSRVAKYVEVRDDLKKEAPEIQPQKTAVDPTRNQHARDALAVRIRQARATARQGDIFAEPIAARIRERLNRELRGRGTADTRSVIRDDAPPKFSLHVNDSYPDGVSLPTVPGNVLAVLPALPDGLEYRIVDAHLILRDTEANIIVDYLFNVMCGTC